MTEEIVKVTQEWDRSLITRIDAYRFTHKISSRKESMEKLIEMALNLVGLDEEMVEKYKKDVIFLAKIEGFYAIFHQNFVKFDEKAPKIVQIRHFLVDFEQFLNDFEAEQYKEDCELIENRGFELIRFVMLNYPSLYERITPELKRITKNKRYKTFKGQLLKQTHIPEAL